MILNSTKSHISHIFKTINTPFRKKLDFQKLNNKINGLLRREQKINSFIMGKEVDMPVREQFFSPYNNKSSIYSFGYLNGKTLEKALERTEQTKHIWRSFTPEKQHQIFLDAADLIEGKYFYDMMAATMVNQGKNAYEAEIDCIQELCDFLRFNVQYADEIKSTHPLSPNPKSVINKNQYLPLLGYTTAITPFNFTAIAGNLATAPLLFGNVNFWKPSLKSLLSNKLFLDILLEANMPPEVLNFCIMDPQLFTYETSRQNLGAVLFTGSSYVFEQIKNQVNHVKHLRANANVRFVGETGGKNFHFIDEDVDLDLAAFKTVESAYNYSGQKCSACSRVYVPKVLEEEFIKRLKHYLSSSSNYTNSSRSNYGLIDRSSFERTWQTIASLKSREDTTLIFGGNVNDEKNFYIEPTLFKTVNKYSQLYRKEFFAPILVMYSYVDKIEAMDHCANITNYRLTGSVFSTNEKFINDALYYFRYCAGNLYVNDKSTGAVVGQQPFGGFGISGTNDKAGDKKMLIPLYLQQTIKFNHQQMKNEK